MCGRSRCVLAPEQVEQAAGVQPGRWTDRERYRPSHNVQPGHWTPIVRMDEQQQGRLLQTMKWGLVPSFTKAGETPDHFRMFNARSESVTEKPVFSRLLQRQRCVVLLDGFYEWKADAGGKKQPYYVSFGEGNVMRMAGLYDVWTGAPDGPLATYTIMTVDASPKLTWLHNRMPVLLQDDAAVEAWLGGGSSKGSELQPHSHDEQQQQQEEEAASNQEDEGAAAASKSAAAASKSAAAAAAQLVAHGGKASAFKLVNQLCVPCNSEALKWHPVTPAMSKPSYDNPDACRDVRTKKGSIGTFFKPAAGPAAAAAAAAAGDGGKAAASPPKLQQQAHVAPNTSSSPAAKQAHHQQQHHQQQQQQHKKSPGAKKGSISSFFKPVGSPAGRGTAADKQQQQQQAEGAVRNADEQSGPSPADNAAAEAAGSAGKQKRAAAAPAGAAAAKKVKAEG